VGERRYRSRRRRPENERGSRRRSPRMSERRCRSRKHRPENEHGIRRLSPSWASADAGAGGARNHSGDTAPWAGADLLQAQPRGRTPTFNRRGPVAGANHPEAQPLGRRPSTGTLTAGNTRPCDPSLSLLDLCPHGLLPSPPLHPHEIMTQRCRPSVTPQRTLQSATLWTISAAATALA